MIPAIYQALPFPDDLSYIDRPESVKISGVKTWQINQNGEYTCIKKYW
jgi:hypothetical protein